MMDRVDEVCDRCKKPIHMLVKDFERAMKDGEPVLCEECYGEYLDEQTQAIPKRCFEYYSVILECIDYPMDDLGREGWELVSVDSGIAYFKREYMKEG